MFFLASGSAEQIAQQNVEELLHLITYIRRMTGLPLPLIALILSLFTAACAKVLNFFIRRTMRRISERNSKFTPLMASLASRILGFLVWVIAVLAILEFWGIDLTPVLAGLGITGVVLGFALQESIASLFAGVMIAVNDPFRVGDWIEVGGDISGTVVSMDMMCVTLASGDNKKITLNNKYVWGNTIVNTSYTDRRRMDFVVTLAYDADTEKAKKVIRDLVESYPEVLKDPRPLVEVGEYADSSINIYARPWVKPSDYGTVNWRFNSDILRVLHENNLDMPYNQLDVHLIKES